MVKGTFEYVFQQVLWLIGSAAQLIAAMGIGIKWMFMTVRCVTFAALDLMYFMPNILWYLLSPNIIRRVSYRSSRTTKLRNLEALLSKQVSADPLTSAVRSGTFSWNSMGNHHEAFLQGNCATGSRRAASPSLPLPSGPEVDRETVERWACAINPADGTFVNGLPVNMTDEESPPSASRLSTALKYNNSFDDTLAALQRVYRHRSQQQQQQGKMNFVTSHAESSLSQVSVFPDGSNESFTDSDDEADVEDRMNLHNRATLDIYLPVPLDSLFRFMDQERKSNETALMQDCEKSHDSRKSGDGGTARRQPQHPAQKRRCKLLRKRFPILISVNGGAWIIGCYFWNFLIARLFAARGYVVFCPDYRNFPQTTMEGMTLDVSDAIAWVLNNAERYNGDLNNVTLIGHSAGAHLTMMSLLSQAQLSAYRCNAEQGTYEGVPPPSDVAYNVPRYNPRESIHRYVGLSGIYNVESLVRHFDQRGLYRDVLYQIAGGRDQLARYSIHAYFDDRRGGDTGEVLPDNIFDFFPQRMFFMHGDADKSAPIGESSSLVGMLRAAQERYTQRRSVRNEEARRHAQRSRRLLPGVLAAAAGEARSSSTAPTIGVSTSASARRTTAVDFANVGSTAMTAAEGPFCAAVKLSDPSEIILVQNSDPFHTDAAPYLPPQQQQQPYATDAPLFSILSPMSISPIIPSSREDRAQPPVEVGFLVISGGGHSDAFVDECVAAGRSCCVDFLCDYESAIDLQGNTSESVSHRPDCEGTSGDPLSGSVWTASMTAEDRAPLFGAHASKMSVMPDAVLPLAVPYEERSLPLRLCTMISPF